MSDEITFLRWCHQNQNRFVFGDSKWVDRDMMNATYEKETGNKVPGDYQLTR